MTIRTKSIPTVIATCALLLLLATAPALAVDGEILIDQAKVNAGGITPGDAPGFPATLSRPGRYKLTGNLVVPAGQTGIVVTQHDVTIDLDGFTISSNPPGQASFGIHAASVTGLSVANGTITGFSAPGVYNVGGRFAVVEDMRLVSNQFGFEGGSDARIRTSTIASGFIGIVCTGCLVERNVITGNTRDGISVFDQAGLVLGNVIVGNGRFGLISNAKTGYGNNILFGNNGGGAQVNAQPAQLHPNVCDPPCP